MSELLDGNGMIGWVVAFVLMVIWIGLEIERMIKK
jgi:hypothetical protein